MYITENRGTIEFKVSKFSSIRGIVRPIFDKQPLQGNKSQDYSNFRELMEIKAHLTKVRSDTKNKEWYE